jgi:hypothetical protein
MAWPACRGGVPITNHIGASEPHSATWRVNSPPRLDTSTGTESAMNGVTVTMVGR